jgi:hypothetical protein
VAAARRPSVTVGVPRIVRIGEPRLSAQPNLRPAADWRDDGSLPRRIGVLHCLCLLEMSLLIRKQ